MQVSRAVAQQRGSSLIPEAAYTDHMHMKFGRQVTMMVMMTLMRMVMKMAKIMMMMTMVVIVMMIFFKEVNNLHLCVFEEHLDKDGLEWSPLFTIGMD